MCLLKDKYLKNTNDDEVGEMVRDRWGDPAEYRGECGQDGGDWGLGGDRRGDPAECGGQSGQDWREWGSGGDRRGDPAECGGQSRQDWGEWSGQDWRENEDQEKIGEGTQQNAEDKVDKVDWQHGSTYINHGGTSQALRKLLLNSQQPDWKVDEARRQWLIARSASSLVLWLLWLIPKAHTNNHNRFCSPRQQPQEIL